MIFHVMKDQGLIIHFVISRTFLDDRRIAINNYLFSRHSPSCFILWILLWQGIKFKRWEHFTYILKLYKLGEIVFFMKKAFVAFCHFVCLVQSFQLTFPQWKNTEWNENECTYVGCVICLKCEVLALLMSIIIYLVSSSKDMGYICDKKGKKLSGWETPLIVPYLYRVSHNLVFTLSWLFSQLPVLLQRILLPFVNMNLIIF